MPTNISKYGILKKYQKNKPLYIPDTYYYAY